MRLLAIAGIIATILAGACQPASAVTIKLATLAPEGSPWYAGLRDIVESWREISKGVIDVRIYPGGVAGDDPSMVRKMRIGQIHAAAISLEGLSRITPDVLAVELPMLIASNEELDYLIERIGPEIEAALEAAGFKLLTWGEAGWIRLFSRKPVVVPDDLRSLRMFAWAENGALEMWRARGYEAYSLTVPEILTALQSGLIDVVPAPPIAALANQWFGIANHMTDLRMSPFIGAVVMTSRGWSQIPEEFRERFLQVARARGAKLSAELDRIESEAIEVMQKHGLVVHHVLPEQTRLWADEIHAAYPTMFDWGIPEDMVRKIEKLLAEFREGDQDGQAG